MGKRLTMGSLFDGIGGFMLAAKQCGIIPLWASEIDKNCISITKRKFPEVRHLGDITQICGKEIPPADIITFGSPCQNLSVAGDRKGLAGEKSGLFLEALFGKMYPVLFHRTIDEIFVRCLKKSQKPIFQCLDIGGAMPEWYEGERLTQHGGYLMPSNV